MRSGFVTLAITSSIRSHVRHHPHRALHSVDWLKSLSAFLNRSPSRRRNGHTALCEALPPRSPSARRPRGLTPREQIGNVWAGQPSPIATIQPTSLIPLAIGRSNGPTTFCRRIRSGWTLPFVNFGSDVHAPDWSSNSDRDDSLVGTRETPVAPEGQLRFVKGPTDLAQSSAVGGGLK